MAPQFDLPPSIRSSRLGVASLIIGIVAICCAWIPFCGLGTIPLAIIGLILGIISLLIVLTNDRLQRGYPIAGVFVNVAAIAIAIVVSVAASRAIKDAANRSATPATQSVPPTAPGK